MPSELWAIFRKNRQLLHDLPALGAAVIQQWINMKYGANALIMIVPHTFGGDLKFNCHLHILISMGGFENSTGQWIPSLELNKDAIMKMWRYAVIEHLRRALKAGVLNSALNNRSTRDLLSTAYYSEKHPRWIILWTRSFLKHISYATRLGMSVDRRLRRGGFSMSSMDGYSSLPKTQGTEEWLRHHLRLMPLSNFSRCMYQTITAMEFAILGFCLRV
jgi:hypothetical protein